MRLIGGLAVDMTRKGALMPAVGSKQAVQQTSTPKGVAAAKRDEKPAMAARMAIYCQLESDDQLPHQDA
jgi:hypothetical protein